MNDVLHQNNMEKRAKIKTRWSLTKIQCTACRSFDKVKKIKLFIQIFFFAFYLMAIAMDAQTTTTLKPTTPAKQNITSPTPKLTTPKAEVTTATSKLTTFRNF